MARINSNEYWDTRFKEDWTEFGGAEQSRYFSKILIEALPEWLTKYLRDFDGSICDWGCAQGDGTDIFSSTFNKKVIGVDFSPIAIEKAKEAYESSEYLHLNLLDEKDPKNFHTDVLISSNTLEHFFKPYDVLNKLKDAAREFLIVSVPYEEVNRIDEHHYTFLSSNIPYNLGDSWHLVFNRVVDCSDHSPSYWPGKQVVLVYGNSGLMPKHSLVMENVSCSSGNDINFFTSMLIKAQRETKEIELENSILNMELERVKIELEKVRAENAKRLSVRIFLSKLKRGLK